MDRRVAAALVLALVVAGLGVGWWVGGSGAGTAEVPEPRLHGMPVADDGPQQEHVRAIGDRPAAAEGAPNVVVVFGCTVRRDQTTPYGGPAETTPFLAQLASQGALFEDVVAASSWTKATTTAVITGQHPLSLGLPEPKRHPSRRVLPDEAKTLAERLVERGYVTLGVTANPNLNAEVGMAQGFDRYHDSRDKGFARRNKISGDEVVDLALQMLDERPDDQVERPFYLRLMMIDAHTPRYPSDEEVERFSEPDVPHLLAQYRALLRRVDDAVAKLDTELAARGYDPDNTVFVFLADHGEGLHMPPHHRGGHGKGMYASTVNVPLIVRGPGVLAGHRVPGMVSGVDITPTVMGLLDAPVDAEAEDLPGFDWSALVRGAEGGATRDRAYAFSMFHGAHVASIWTPTTQCQQDYGTYGTQDHPLRVGCFDRQADPDFTTPHEDLALMAELEVWREARMDEFEGWPVVEWDPDADVARQLEALGYVEGADD